MLIVTIAKLENSFDQPDAKIELMKRQWSGRHHQIVQGIDLLT